MRPDAVITFMDRFGDMIYNNYNATEAGMIATAIPSDLRAAPDTAGRPAVGTDIRILDGQFHEVPAGEVGRITCAAPPSSTATPRGHKEFHDDYMSPATSAGWTRPGGCTSSAATTR